MYAGLFREEKVSELFFGILSDEKGQRLGKTVLTPFPPPFLQLPDILGEIEKRKGQPEASEP